MRAQLFPLSAALKLLPDPLHAEVLTRLFNHLLKGQYIADQLQELDGKRLAIHITDATTRLLFQVQGNHLVRVAWRGERPWDVCIRGRLEDFWLLATREEDPDTLFFNRTLAIEGETETGLHLKNLLDSLDFDWDAHLQAVLGPRLAPLAGRYSRQLGLERHFKRLMGVSGGTGSPPPERRA